MTMDISDTLAPDSDQLDAIDLAAGPQTFTVKSVSRGNAEQPVQVHLVEFPRGPWRPGKNMRRVLVACWGANASDWAGRRVELYCDPAVRYGADLVGGTRIARLSHIDKQQKIPLLVSRGKSAIYTVQPIEASPSRGEAEASRKLASAESNRSPDSEGEPAFGAGPSTTGGGAESGAEAQRSEAAAPQESLRSAINRTVREIQNENGGAHLKTWCDSVGVAQTSGAIADRFGERARNLRALMSEEVTDATEE